MLASVWMFARCMHEINVNNNVLCGTQTCELMIEYIIEIAYGE